MFHCPQMSSILWEFLAWGFCLQDGKRRYQEAIARKKIRLDRYANLKSSAFSPSGWYGSRLMCLMSDMYAAVSKSIHIQIYAEFPSSWRKKYVSNVTWLLAKCKLTDIVCLHAFQLSILFTQLNPGRSIKIVLDQYFMLDESRLIIAKPTKNHLPQQITRCRTWWHWNPGSRCRFVCLLVLNTIHSSDTLPEHMTWQSTMSQLSSLWCRVCQA